MRTSQELQPCDITALCLLRQMLAPLARLFSFLMRLLAQDIEVDASYIAHVVIRQVFLNGERDMFVREVGPAGSFVKETDVEMRIEQRLV